MCPSMPSVAAMIHQMALPLVGVAMLDNLAVIPLGR